MLAPLHSMVIYFLDAVFILSVEEYVVAPCSDPFELSVELSIFMTKC